jgi:hypothetical protein
MALSRSSVETREPDYNSVTTFARFYDGVCGDSVP